MSLFILFCVAFWDLNHGSVNAGLLVIGATNRRDVLDDALLRPGRLDRTIHLGYPSKENRYKILTVHAPGKAIPRDNDDALLREVAAKTDGFSGAELANSLNEAAILGVRAVPLWRPLPSLPFCCFCLKSHLHCVA